MRVPDFLLAFVLVAVVLIATALASGLVERSPLSFPLLFLGLGFALGENGLRVIALGLHAPALEVVAALTEGDDGEAAVAPWYRTTIASGELREGVTAFADRRPPRFPWSG